VAELWHHLLDGMGAVLAFFYALIPSYGVAIIGLTVAVRLLLFPLTAKQARSMQKMQLIQPEIKRIQAKYKDDRQKLNEEIMKFYKEQQVNPLAGCLPLVAQMPIFFALFAVLRHTVAHVPQNSKLFHAFCGAADRAACKPKGLGFLGMNLSEAASANHGSFIHALPYFILIALVVVTGYLQFKQTQSRQGAAAQANPQAQIMGKVFPLMFAFISLNLPSGVVLYFLVSNAWQIGQQALIFGSLLPAGPATEEAPPAPKPASKGGGAPKTTEASKSANPPRDGGDTKSAGTSKAGASPRRGTPAGKGGRPGKAAGTPTPRPGDPKAGDPSSKSGNGSDAKPGAKPEPRPRNVGRDGTPPASDGQGRAQPSGTRPRPRSKKRRR
jgi:YidC/Oxa1 family membrane protein insertase